MKLFETPAIEVVKFAVEDVITVSGGEETTTETEEMGFYPAPCY